MPTPETTVVAGLLVLLTTVVGLVSTIVGWLLRDFSRRLDGLPARVAEALTGLVGASRRETMTELAGRFDEVDRRIERLTRAAELAARVELLRIVAQPETPARVRAQVEPLLRELNGDE